jgi:hypothetical protein
MDAESSRFVGGGRHHAAPVSGKAAYNDRLPSVFRMIELFYRGIECVKVRMYKTVHIIMIQASGFSSILL